MGRISKRMISKQRLCQDDSFGEYKGKLAGMEVGREVEKFRQSKSHRAKE
jgi:hypothetical protein